VTVSQPSVWLEPCAPSGASLDQLLEVKRVGRVWNRTDNAFGNLVQRREQSLRLHAWIKAVEEAPREGRAAADIAHGLVGDHLIAVTVRWEETGEVQRLGYVSWVSAGEMNAIGTYSPLHSALRLARVGETVPFALPSRVPHGVTVVAVE
jgi:hypothetical protein